MDLKLYKRPLTALAAAGSRARVTPGVIYKFSKALFNEKINVQGISSGEYSITFYVDEESGPKASSLLKKVIMQKTAFEALITKKNIALVSINGKELLNSPGMLSHLIGPLGENNIDILSVTTSFDSVMIFINWKNRKKAFKLIENAFKKGKV